MKKKSDYYILNHIYDLNFYVFVIIFITAVTDIEIMTKLSKKMYV